MYKKATSTAIGRIFEERGWLGADDGEEKVRIFDGEKIKAGQWFGGGRRQKQESAY